MLTQATTALGAGYWVLTRCKPARGTQVLVNRGFVPQDQACALARRGRCRYICQRTATVVGLLRMSEPAAAFCAATTLPAALAFARCGGHCAGAATGTPGAFLCGRGPALAQSPASADLPRRKTAPWPRVRADGGALSTATWCMR